MNSLFGMKVISSPLIEPVPKIQLSHDFNACSPHVKKEMNNWLRERFGTKEVCFVMGDTVLMNPKHFAMLCNFTA